MSCLDAAILRACFTTLEGDVAALCASACVCKAWHLAATRDSHVWHRIVVPAAIAGKLTDERLAVLLSRSHGVLERLCISDCAALSATAIAGAIAAGHDTLTHLAVANTSIFARQLQEALDGVRLEFLSVRGIRALGYGRNPADEKRVLPMLISQLQDCAGGSEGCVSWSVCEESDRYYTVRKELEAPGSRTWQRGPTKIVHYAKDPRCYGEADNPEHEPNDNIPLKMDDDAPLRDNGLDVRRACVTLKVTGGHLAYGHDVFASPGRSLEDAVSMCGRLCGGPGARAAGDIMCSECGNFVCNSCVPLLIECNVHNLLVCNGCMLVQDGYWCNEDCFNER